MSRGAAVASERARSVRPIGALSIAATSAAIDDDDEAQDHRVAVASPRRRMDEERRPDDVAHDPVDDLDRVIGRAELDAATARPVRPGQLEVVAVQPDDEHLGLDRDPRRRSRGGRFVTAGS